MIGTETTIVRRDADNKPLTVDMDSGRVERPNTYYPATLHTDHARRLFLAGVGIVESHEVPAFIRACNAVVGRKTLTDDRARLDAAWRSAGLPMVGNAADVKSAKRHPANCRCPRCLAAHTGCRRFYCPVCG